MSSLKKIGILHGRERTFPDAFIETINARRIPGIMAERVVLGGTAYNEPQQYAVIVDRMSHEIKYYRGYLKLAALNGTRVVNNPFWWSADDKFFGTALAARLGVAVPKTILLPNREHPEGTVPESFANLKFPIDWEGMLAYVGLPAIIKPAEGGGGKSVSKVHSLEELWAAYDESGNVQMMLQECIEWEHYVRCLCVGQEKILPIKWHPPFGRVFGEYFLDHNHLSPELGARVVRDAIAINRSLGYDMNTVEFAIRDGIPYAIDFTNPAPDFDLHSLKDHYFWQVVEWMTEMAIQKAQEPGTPSVNLKWWSMMGWNEPSSASSNGNGRHSEEKAPVASAAHAVGAAAAKPSPAKAAPVKTAPSAPVKTAPSAPVKTAPAAPVKTAPSAPARTAPARPAQKPATAGKPAPASVAPKSESKGSSAPGKKKQGK
jgi:hypothetical protein